MDQTLAEQSFQEAKRLHHAGRVRCVKPKADCVSVVKTKTAKKKVARKKSKASNIKGRTKVLAQ